MGSTPLLAAFFLQTTRAAALCGDGFWTFFCSLPSRLQITLVTFTSANLFPLLRRGTLHKEGERKVGDRMAHRRHHVYEALAVLFSALENTCTNGY
jgi:hypothetical protein